MLKVRYKGYLLLSLGCKGQKPELTITWINAKSQKRGVVLTEVTETCFFWYLSIITGYFMYTETSSPRQQGDNAKLNSPKLQFSGNMCLQFFYHMYGSTMGTLNVEVNGVNVFSKSGDQGKIWHEATKDVNLSGMFTVREVFGATLKLPRIKLL